MKFLVIFALALSTACAIDLRKAEIKPVIETEGRITNGEYAKAGQFPHQVGLEIRMIWLSSQWCGGSIIGRNWVLSAAHCTDGAEYANVFLGSITIFEAEVEFRVFNSDFINHPGWNKTTKENDIALIKIPTIDYNANIQPIKLPAISDSYSSYVGDEAIFSGWGYTTDDSALFYTLLWGRRDIISNESCAPSYDFIFDSNVCVATTGGVSPCKGDSGGPMVLESSNILIGVTSYGSKKGCTKGIPVAFTRVTSFLNWIDDNTGISY